MTQTTPHKIAVDKTATEKLEQIIAQKVPRPLTKIAHMLSLLQTGTGASLEDMVEVTGWQEHSVRAAMTGLRKKGHIINKHVEGNTTIWSASQVQS